MFYLSFTYSHKRNTNTYEFTLIFYHTDSRVLHPYYTSFLLSLSVCLSIYLSTYICLYLSIPTPTPISLVSPSFCLPKETQMHKEEFTLLSCPSKSPVVSPFLSVCPFGLYLSALISAAWMSAFSLSVCAYLLF